MTNPDKYWRALPSDSWEVRARKNRDLRLTNVELNHFRDYKDSSYTGRDMQNNRIPNALDNIPRRFEDLSEDIAFLKQGGEITEELWTEMLNIDQRADHLNDVLASDHEKSETKEFQLGSEVGSIFEAVMGNNASEDDRTKVLHGFAHALTGRSLEI